MTQTENLSLNLWDATDPVDVDQINANFSKLDGSREQLLSTVTVSATTTTITVDVSDVDWNKYKTVTLRCYIIADSTLYARTNTSGTNDTQYVYGSLSSTSKRLAYVNTTDDDDGDCPTWLILKSNYNENCKIRVEFQGSSWGVGWNKYMTYADLTNLTIYNDEAVISAGSYIEVWGEL